MIKGNIDGVKIKKLKRIDDERGFLMEILRDDDETFNKFGQVYVTACNPGYVKGWHLHKIQTDNFAVVSGKARILLCDKREESETYNECMEIITSAEENQVLVTVPPGVLHGWECIGNEQLLVVNAPTHHYNYENPDEYRVDPFDNDITVRWNNKKGG